MRRLVALLLLALGAASVYADDCGINVPLTAFADEEITVSTSAKGLTQATYAPDLAGGGGGNAVMALITLSGANLRMRFTGAAATTDLGNVVIANSSVLVCQADLPHVSMIRDDSTDVEVTVTYFRRIQ